jgi:hypothetical protein
VDQILQKLDDQNCTDVDNGKVLTSNCLPNLRSLISAELTDYENQLNVNVPDPNNTIWSFEKVEKSIYLKNLPAPPPTQSRRLFFKK